MADNKVYRSSFTATEIEKILMSVGEKFNKSSLVQDLQIGGVENAVSAEVLKEIINKIIQDTTGDGLKAAINAADDSNVFTDAMKNSLQNMSLRFIGTKANITERNNLNTSDYIGGEVILLLKNESDQIVFQYWDNATSTWLDVYQAESRTITVANAGDSVLKQFPKTKWKVLEASIIAKGPGDDGDFHVTTARIGWKGSDIMITTFGDMYSEKLFDINALSAANDNIALTATTLVDNTSIHIEVLNVY